MEICERVRDSGRGSFETEICLIFFSTKHSWKCERRCQRQSVHFTRGRPQRSKLVLICLAPEIPGSLKLCQKQSQTGALKSGGSIEVETGLN